MLKGGRCGSIPAGDRELSVPSMSEHHPCLGAVELDRIARRQTEKSAFSATLALIAVLAVSHPAKTGARDLGGDVAGSDIRHDADDRLPCLCPSFIVRPWPKHCQATPR
jgi:hypothetical protein